MTVFFFCFVLLFLLYTFSATQRQFKKRLKKLTIVPRCVKGQRMSEGDLRSSPRDKRRRQFRAAGFFFWRSPVRQNRQCQPDSTDLTVHAGRDACFLMGQQGSPTVLKGCTKIPCFRFSEKGDKIPPTSPNFAPNSSKGQALPGKEKTLALRLSSRPWQCWTNKYFVEKNGHSPHMRETEREKNATCLSRGCIKNRAGPKETKIDCTKVTGRRS